MKKLRVIILLAFAVAASALWSATYSVDQVPNVQKSDYTKHLVNPDGIVSPRAQATIDSLLLSLRRGTSVEAVAVVVDAIDTDDANQFATDLFRKWGLGKQDKSNGLLMLVAKDSHDVVFRTGYGLEGVMPDILAGRIIRNQMFPYFREGDFDQGMINGVSEVCRMLSDPEAREEVMSSMKDNYDDDDDIDLFTAYLIFGGICATAMMLWLLITLYQMRGKSGYDKYRATTKMQQCMWIVGVLFIGLPLLSALILYFLRRRWRYRQRTCQQCGTKMVKLPEEADNAYLTEIQDLEERIDSVDYDVWRCPHCGEIDVLGFVKPLSPYKECKQCGARAYAQVSDQVMVQPTYQRAGYGYRTYECKHCHLRKQEKYYIPKLERQAPVVIGGIGGGIGRGGGGGPIGGGFGGGFTGGGGAAGRW